MMYVSITSHTHTVKLRWWPRHPGTTDAELRANLKTLRSLPSGHGIELGFFSWLQNYRPHPREPELAKVGPRDFSKNHLS